MSKRAGAVVVLWVVFCAWTLGGWVAVLRIDAPTCTVIARGAYDVRRCPSYLVAQVVSDGPVTVLLERGGAVLASYLAGANTAPVVWGMPASAAASFEKHERITAHAPLVLERTLRGNVLSAILPARYRIADVPRPDDPTIRMVLVPERVDAVVALTGRVSEVDLIGIASDLAERVKSDHHWPVSTFRTTRYAPSWVPPFLSRTEVALTLRDDWD